MADTLRLLLAVPSPIKPDTGCSVISGGIWPLAVIWISKGFSSVSLLAISTVVVCTPSIVGEKVTVKVVVSPAGTEERVPGKSKLNSPAPFKLTLTILRLAVPAF